MFETLLIANRGEIAVRIARTARRMGLRTVAVHSDADTDALHVRSADLAVRIGPPPARESYLSVEAILAAARETGAQAIHPGYGFLSENPDFAEAVEAAGLVWVGPPPAAIRAMGLKDEAKRIARAAGVPVVPGVEGDDVAPARLAKAAAGIGFPLLVKAVAGGGGRGIRRVDGPAELADAVESARREAAAAFGDDRILLEKLVARPRHLEVQVFGDAHGNVVHLFERDCSLQRRRQKLVEEAPAPGMNAETRAALTQAAIGLARAVGYRNAGTVEFVADGSGPLRPDGVYFLEMNTRLQVEHPVTEMVTGLDLVEWQLRVAAGEPLPLTQDAITLRGHAIEARVVAEDPAAGFVPQTGIVRCVGDDAPGEGVRWDRGFEHGDRVPPTYDSLLAKLIVHGDDRALAVARLGMALAAGGMRAPVTNAGFLGRVAAHPAFAEGGFDTGFLDRFADTLVAPAEADARTAALVAGAARLAAARAGGGDGGFGRADGFRLNAAPRHATEVLLDERAVRVETGLLPCGGVSVAGDHGVLRLEGAGAHWTARRVSDGAAIAAVTLDRLGAHVRLGAQGFEIGFARRVAEGEGVGGDAALSPMPGKVVAVRVTPGQTVARGDALAVVEAMKMELTVAAPRDGTVEAVLVAAGEQVAEKAVLVTLVPED